MYDLGDRLLMVASDRISTYDVVHPTPIPDKGKVLTGLSAFWFAQTGHIVPNHLCRPPTACPTRSAAARSWCASSRCCPSSASCAATSPARAGRTTRRPARSAGSRCRPGCASPSACPTPIFTPSTKAEDRPRRDDRLRPGRRARRRPRRSMDAVRDVSLALYAFAADHARARGVILADTKFEFGLDADGELVVGDEVLTPDSSRFWPADSYEPGRSQPIVRQAVRARLGVRDRLGQEPPAPAIPDEVVERHARRATSRPTSGSPARPSAPGSTDGVVMPRARPRPPQGRASSIRRASPSSRRCRRSASSGVANVHVGRLIELDVEDPARWPRCARSCWPTR